VTEGASEQGQEVGGLSSRAATRLAWSLWALCVALIALAGLLDHLTLHDVPRTEWSPAAWLFDKGVIYLAVWLPYPTVGAVIASRRPANPVGWLFCFAGLLFIVPSLAIAYADYALVERHDRLPGTLLMATASDKSEEVSLWGLLLVLALLPLVYPDGRLLSREWRIVAWGALIGCAMGALVVVTGPGPLDRYPSINNPLGIEVSWVVTVMAVMVSGFLAVVSGVLSWMSWVVRWQRAQGEERQQLKWFAYGFLLIVVSLPFPWLLTPLALALLPVTLGIALLKYHLYDIDLLINRTLVYGALTGVLALVYFGGVAATQVVFGRLTGQDDLPQLAIVASTLLIAALFSPLRRWVQGFVDKRFYRRKYDARKTLDAFSATLRDETDLDRLEEDLVGVVVDTMQPAHVSLWLRPDREAMGGRGGEP
jgi:hypothetical protein